MLTGGPSPGRDLQCPLRDLGDRMAPRSKSLPSPSHKGERSRPSHAPVRLSEFRMAIRQMLDVDAEPAGAVELHVRHKNGEDWQGTVHVFDISGHPRASQCYAWPEPVDEASLIIRVVSAAGRITSPQQAVRSILNRRRQT
jgi:hypothetical protein